MTEDSGSEMLRAIISQWTSIDRNIAIWPFHGSGKLPPAETLEGLENLFGKNIKIVVHRDKDFLTEAEVNSISKNYHSKNINFWATKFSDIEAYWNHKEIIQHHFNISAQQADLILSEAVAACKKSDQHLKKLRSKRKDAGNNIPDLKNGILPQVGEDTIIATYEALGEYQSILGKDLCASIKNVANSKSLPNVASFGKTIPKNLSFEIAEDLKMLLK